LIGGETMYHEIPNCIDAGTEYCPCKLAETGDCIICSQLSNKEFCDCVNWKGVCIYEEYVWNDCKAKNGRKEYQSKIVKKDFIKENLILLSIKLEHSLITDLDKPGSFIFIRNPKCDEYYNVPISLLSVDLYEDLVDVCIEIKGIKTKMLCDLDSMDDIIVKGPFWNGIMGIDKLNSVHDGNSIVVAKGIGQAPALPALKRLYENNNKIDLIIDKKPYGTILFENYFRNYRVNVIECDTLCNGSLTEEFKKLLKNLIDEDTNLIHCVGADILNYELLEFINSTEDFKSKIKYSCSNNAKMCCGEGICGACAARFKGGLTKKFCKYQIEPEFIFERRRLI
jgi:dihydroorotate dehydrogenase electron transfer subunit